MRAVVQRTTEASVLCGDHREEISTGLVVLIGVEGDDASEDVDWLVKKIIGMRIFPDEDGKMNRSVIDVTGELLLISQFTLHASIRKGNRPSFIRAASPERAAELYEEFCKKTAEQSGCRVAMGVFGGNMRVTLVNDGPVTILIDSRSRE